MIRPGSKCIPSGTKNQYGGMTGVCSNPYANGCLQSHLPELKPSMRDALLRQFPGIEHGRICNSDDDSDDEEKDCYEPLFDYTEVRIHNGNWESSIFLSWIYQIVLMELIEVPVTVGLGPSGGKQHEGVKDSTYDASFYNPKNTFSYSSKSYPWDALRAANRVGDCRRLQVASPPALARPVRRTGASRAPVARQTMDAYIAERPY